MGKPMPEEMEVLRRYLEFEGIAWKDVSDQRDMIDDEHAMMSYGGYTRIYRTHWKFGGHRYSAICGFGTYGCEDDSIELMVDGYEPIGNLCARSVMGIMELVIEVGR